MSKLSQNTLNYEMLTEGKADCKRVAFIMGWGITLRDPWLSWLKGQAEAMNWSLLVIALPYEYKSFRQVLTEIEAIINKSRWDLLLCHSMGALFGRYLETDKIRQRIFISPFWKIPQRTLILGSYQVSRLVLNFLKWCRKPFLYRNFEDADVGEIDLPKEVPRYISPRTMQQVMQAQRHLPPLLSEDKIIFCPEDAVVDTSELKGITFAGGHFPFSLKERDSILLRIADLIR
jgi:hypothetical protein